MPHPTDHNAILAARRKKATPQGFFVLHDLYITRAENATLWDADGNTYIDFGAGISALNTGHSNPKIIAAVEKQLHHFTHTAYTTLPYESYVHLAERLNALAPISEDCKSVFFTTGAEAVENAVKIAKAYTGRYGVIAFGGAFHGRTAFTMSLTGKVLPYKKDFGAGAASVFHAQFPIPSKGVSVQNAIDSIQHIFASDMHPEHTAAIIIEAVQGEGGFYQAPVEFMQQLRALCDTHGIVLIVDEVQTGFARTGKLFAMEHYGVEPDLMPIAKSMAGGFPLSGVIGRAQIMDAPHPGGIGGTYAGNPLALAAAHAVLDIIKEDKLLERSVALGAQLRDTLSKVAKHTPAISDVRALGSMVAVEFRDPKTGAPDAAYTARVQKRALEHKLILLTCGKYGNVIRFIYPLTIPQAQFDEALAIIEKAVKE